MFSTNQLLQVFDEQILPAQLQVGSRVNYWSCWRQVLTFGLAHGELDKKFSQFYSGLSMRRGGITAAVQARVSEPVLFRQSGHGTALAGRRYVDPVDPRVLYATGRAILSPEGIYVI